MSEAILECLRPTWSVQNQLETSWASLGYPEANMGYQKANLGHLEVNLGHLEVNVGHQEVNLGYPEANLGHPEAILECLRSTWSIQDQLGTSGGQV